MSSALEFHDIALTIARRAAAIAVQRRRDGVEIAASKSTLTDIVTSADREVEGLIRDTLAAVRPHDGFFGEETGAQTGTSGLTWVVDPIDGTVNYFYDIPAYAVSVAVVEGEPDPLTWSALAGAVVNPARNEVFSAAAGQGAWRNGSALTIGGPVELPMALVGTGFGYDASVRVQQATLVTELIGQVRDIRRIGSAALDLCDVAAGRLDAFYERGLNPWDHAAGALIAAEAGATISVEASENPARQLVIAAQPRLYSRLAPIVHGFYDSQKTQG